MYTNSEMTNTEAAITLRAMLASLIDARTARGNGKTKRTHMIKALIKAINVLEES